MRNLEIELTFLAASIPAEIRNATPTQLTDIYIPEDSPFPVLRARKQGNKYEITKKIPVNEGDFSSHTEHTISLSEDEFEALRKASARVVEKNRYNVKINGYTADVDVFTGALTGLVLLDFEFAAEKEKENFSKPDCCLADVTQEKFILGGQLAGRSFDDIKNNLSRFKYEKLSI